MKGEHTWTRPVYRCVMCCMPAVFASLCFFLSCLFSMVLAFLLLLLQVEQPGNQDANE